MCILIGADIVPTKSNLALFSNGDTRALFGEELLNTIKTADFRIFNLETPITDNECPIEKRGPHLIAPSSAIRSFKEMRVDLFTLANNHIMDHGIQGLHSTLKALEDNGINWVGVGTDCRHAAHPYIFKLKDRVFGVYACAEHEFSVAGDTYSGANPFDPLESFDHVEELKKQSDFVIVLYHGGKEHYRYPTPMLQKVCRKFIDKGADLVVCQHSHCVGCEEHYHKGTIVYGQGNFLFDHSTHECWESGLLIKIGDDLGIEYIPVIKENNLVRYAEGEKAREVLEGFYRRSDEIKQEGFIAKAYKCLADASTIGYLFGLTGVKRNMLYRVLNRVSEGQLDKMVVRCWLTRKQKVVLQNTIDCETHRELILEILRSYSR